jgi:hypothetical protein
MNVAQRPTDLPLNVLMAIGIFMQDSAAEKQILVLSEAIKAIERAFPRCHIPSGELGDAIISAANSCGVAVVSAAQRIGIDDEETASRNEYSRGPDEI